MAPAIASAPHHTTSNGDIPTVYVLGYLAIALLVWVGTAIAIARRSDADGKSAYELYEAVLLGGIACALWPLSAAGLGIWWVVVRATRTSPRADKSA